MCYVGSRGAPRRGYPPSMNATAPSVLVAEDDLELRIVLVRGLGEEGFATAGAGAAPGLLEAVERRLPDLLIVDVGLPDADGRDVCQALRAQGIQTPVLFLTARDARTHLVTGIN